MTADESNRTKDQDTECPPTQESQTPNERSPAGDAVEPGTSGSESKHEDTPTHTQPPSVEIQPETPTNEPASTSKESPAESGVADEAKPPSDSASSSSLEDERPRSEVVELEARETLPKPATELPSQACEAPQTHTAEPEPQGLSRHTSDMSSSSDQRVFRGPVPSPTPPPEEAPWPKQSPKFPCTPGKTHASPASPNAAAGNSSSHLPPTPPPSAPREHENRATFRGVSLGSQSASSSASTPQKTPGGSHYSPQSERYPRAVSERSRSSGSSGRSVYSSHRHQSRVACETAEEEAAAKSPAPDGDLAFAISGRRLDDLRLGALDKAQRFWELQNDISDDGELWRAKTPSRFPMLLHGA